MRILLGLVNLVGMLMFLVFMGLFLITVWELRNTVLFIPMIAAVGIAGAFLFYWFKPRPVIHRHYSHWK